MSQQPPPMQTRTQVEFGPEEDRTFTALAKNMGTVAWLMNLVGFLFLVLCGLLVWRVVERKEGYAAALGVGTAAAAFLTIGVQTFWAGRSFRRIVETKGRDTWHLMNALETLRGMYGLLRLIIVASAVLVVLAVVLWLIDYYSAG
jgi:uncharacterized membrane protein YbhN (UPF0104 family)